MWHLGCQWPTFLPWPCGESLSVNKSEMRNEVREQENFGSAQEQALVVLAPPLAQWDSPGMVCYLKKYILLCFWAIWVGFLSPGIDRALINALDYLPRNWEFPWFSAMSLVSPWPDLAHNFPQWTPWTWTILPCTFPSLESCRNKSPWRKNGTVCWLIHLGILIKYTWDSNAVHIPHTVIYCLCAEVANPQLQDDKWEASVVPDASILVWNLSPWNCNLII